MLAEHSLVDCFVSFNLDTGVTQELIDETRLGVENAMMNDIKHHLTDNGHLDYCGPNGETLVRLILHLHPHPRVYNSVFTGFYASDSLSQ